MSSLKRRQRARKARDPLAGAKAELATKRALIVRGIDLLLSLLDQIDGDADEEPSLGSDIGVSIIDQRRWSEGATDDREKDNSDKEPSLGALDRADQSRWATGCDTDLEEQSEDEGGQCDDEGAGEDGDRTGSWVFRGREVANVSAIEAMLDEVREVTR